VEIKMSKVFLEPEQIKRMYEIASSYSLKDEVLFRIMGNTGMRVSDVRTLKVSDIQAEDGTIYSSIRKKMKKTKEYVERELTEATREAIKLYLPEVVRRDDYLFPGNKPGKCIGRTFCHSIFKRVLTELLPSSCDLKGASTHTLRRSVSFLIAENTSLQVASEFLGHKSIASTTSYLSKAVLGKKSKEYLDENLNF
jgi:integrase